MLFVCIWHSYTRTQLAAEEMHSTTMKWSRLTSIVSHISGPTRTLIHAQAMITATANPHAMLLPRTRISRATFNSLNSMCGGNYVIIKKRVISYNIGALCAAYHFSLSLFYLSAKALHRIGQCLDQCASHNHMVNTSVRRYAIYHIGMKLKVASEFCSYCATYFACIYMKN